MLPDRVSNPGPLTYESGALPIAPCGPANRVKKSIWKFIDIFPNQDLNFLNIFTEHGKITADYTKSIEKNSQLLCRNVIVERL